MRSLTFGVYLTNTWLAGKRITLAESTWDGYRRKIDRHILPAIGHLRIRRLRAHHQEALYDRMLHPTSLTSARDWLATQLDNEGDQGAGDGTDCADEVRAS